MSIFLSKDRKQEIVEKVLLENYNRYYRMAFSYVQNAADAKDVVQNGAYKAILHSHSLRQEQYAGTWIYRIMLNEIFSMLRRQPVESLEGREAEISCEDTYWEEKTEFDIKEVLDSLPEKDKAVVILRYFEDQKLEEIATILHENVNTVKSRLYRSLKKMRLKLEDSEENDMSKGGYNYER